MILADEYRKHRADGIGAALAMRWARDAIERDQFMVPFSPMSAYELGDIWDMARINPKSVNDCQWDEETGVAFVMTCEMDDSPSDDDRAERTDRQGIGLHAWLRGCGDYLALDGEKGGSRSVGYRLMEEYEANVAEWRKSYGRHEANCRAIKACRDLITSWEKERSYYTCGLAVFYLDASDTWQMCGEVDYLGMCDDSHLDDSAAWFDMGLISAVKHARIEAEQCRLLKALAGSE